MPIDEIGYIFICRYRYDQDETLILATLINRLKKQFYVLGAINRVTEEDCISDHILRKHLNSFDFFSLFLLTCLFCFVGLFDFYFKYLPFRKDVTLYELGHDTSQALVRSTSAKSQHSTKHAMLWFSIGWFYP